MRVTHVSLTETQSAKSAGRPALTPELLAATGARYSRSNEGLETILGRIDPDNLDRSVDSIFRMIDYGHQSIADMAPVAMFMDGISIWLAYYVWSLCPTAGGQESSTRYIRLSPDGLISPDQLGVPPSEQKEWANLLGSAYATYESALAFWENVARDVPDVVRLPNDLLNDPSDKAQRQKARIFRNYAFDRARNFIPSAAATNMMLIMSARGWVALCQQLLSHLLPEPRRLGEMIRQELSLSAPRLLKHATAQANTENGISQEFEYVRQQSNRLTRSYLQSGETFTCPPAEFLEVLLPNGSSSADLANSLQFHEHRYAWIGHHLRRTSVRFGWDAVGFAEIRDLNRHRTGTKHCPLVPVGFYAAQDQLPPSIRSAEWRHQLAEMAGVGVSTSRYAREQLDGGTPSYVYFTLLGTQFPFEHTTTADKFIYEVELRTGTGAHFRYAQHLRDVIRLWYAKFPETKGLVIEGSAEPE